VLSHLQFASIRKKWRENTVKASITRRIPLMTAEAEKHMDGEIDALFSLTL
jgi:hypothetical protein